MYRKRRFSSKLGYRRRKFISKRTRSRRIYRKFIRRAPLKPELKYGLNNFTSSGIAPAGSVTQNLTISTLSSGTGVQNRVGDMVKFTKVTVNMQLLDNSGTTTATASQTRCYTVRTIIWSPRCAYTDATSYMAVLGFLTHIDVAVATIYKDFYTVMSPSYFDEAVIGSVVVNSGNPSVKMYKMSIPFPRNVKISPATNNVDPSKDALYVTWILDGISGTGVKPSFSAKTWFIDT